MKLLRSGAALATATILSIGLGSCGVVHRWRTPGAPGAVDLNTASARRIGELPGITPSMADRIVAGRPYDDPHALVSRGILTEREFRRVEDRVVVRGSAR